MIKSLLYAVAMVVLPFINPQPLQGQYIVDVQA